MMGKTWAVFLVVLGCLFAALSILDKSDYAIEKRLWRAQRQFMDIARDPTSVPEKQFEHVVRLYQDIIKQFPNASLTPRIYIYMGKVYALKKEYPKSREIFEDVLSHYPGDQELCAEALMNTAATYEEEADGRAVLNMYKRIMSDYPLTETGMNMPLYVANYYRRADQSASSQAALKEGISFYQNISSGHPHSQLGFDALRLMTNAYLAQENWLEAVRTLGKILSQYASSPYLNNQRAALIVKSINTVSVTQLKNYDLAINIYQKFIEEHPGHPLNKSLQGMSDGLKELNQRNVATSNTSHPAGGGVGVLQYPAEVLRGGRPRGRPLTEARQ